jgi:alkylhydroperoxidase family enzyme
MSEAAMRAAHGDVFQPHEPIANVFRTIARAPGAFARFQAWGAYVLSRRNGLPAREREILILRTGYLCRSGYEVTQHVRIGLAAGLSEQEIRGIKEGPGAAWEAGDRALICAADQLHRDCFIADDIWTELRRHFSEKQCMDVVFTVGQYTQVCMILNTFGVQLDEGLSLEPGFEPTVEH